MMYRPVSINKNKKTTNFLEKTNCLLLNTDDVHVYSLIKES